MALLALIGIYMLFIALFIALICVVTSTSGGRTGPVVAPPFGAPARPVNKQHANTPASTTGVHHLVSASGCWPGVWVGPSPVASALSTVASRRVPVQRRHPSGIAARATSHGVLR